MKQSAPSSGLLQNGARISLALFILLLPKCGLCLVVYLNVFSILGLSITKYFQYFLPVLSLLLILNLVLGFVKAKRTNSYGSWVLSLAASVLLVINKVWMENYLLSWIAASMLVASAIMQLWLSRKSCSRSLL